ncbi:Uma2 family endonuclease [Myxococcus sp. XM-1-1-1]|nr:Uma2 family endonuclease [Myxococcus sp. XM-1-1-1]
MESGWGVGVYRSEGTVEKKPATYADLEALPETVIGELIDGVLHASPRPALRHSLVSSRLNGELSGPYDKGRGGPGGWFILFEPELHLSGGNVLVPDLAGWRRERMPGIPSGVGCTVVPDWVCEVLSPSTSRLDRFAKQPIYGREGVKHLWLIDPKVRTLEVWRLEGAGYQKVAQHEGLAKVRAEPFEAVELELGFLWDEG